MRVTSLDPVNRFSEICETVTVSAHGCSLRSPMKLDVGVPVYFELREGRQTKGQVVDCQPLGADQKSWQLGMRLEQPDNFWGLQPCPEDWAGLPQNSTPPPLPRVIRPRAAETRPQDSPPAPPQDESHKITETASPDRFSAALDKLIRPLQLEVAELRDKLHHREGTGRSAFEVSLSHIPPELEEKLELRLRQDLAAQLLEHTRLQSQQLLDAAHAAIEQNITDARGEFRHWVEQELRGVKQHARDVAEETSEKLRHHLSLATDGAQQQLTEATARLAAQGEEVFQLMRQRLEEEHQQHRRQIEDVRAALAAESSRVRAQVAEVEDRLSRLNESARQIQSDLDQRLEQTAADIVAGARAQLEGTVEVILKELGARNAQELQEQIEQARERLQRIQAGIETSVAQLLGAQMNDTLQSFEQNVDQLATESVERWRLALAQDFNSLSEILGRQLRAHSASNRNGNRQHDVSDI